MAQHLDTQRFGDLFHGSSRAIIRSLECGLARARAIARLKRDGLHMPRISKLYPYSLQSYWTSKCGQIIPNAIFAQNTPYHVSRK